ALLAVEDADPRVEARQIARIAVDAALPEQERALGIAQRLGELGGLGQDRAPGDLAGLELGLALEHTEPLARPAGLRVQLGEPAGDRQLLVLRRAGRVAGLDEQRDRGCGAGQPPGPRAC